MRHGSLFSGIGGFDLAAQWMGWENVFHCEWNEFGRKILNHHFPEADSFEDITMTDFRKYEGTIDIISGGFPCQPFSLAGKRKGKDDERYLWHEMLRAIQEIKPQFVIAENVYGITNIDGGLVFEKVCIDLETEGYEVQAFVIPACAKDAPHRRDRVWFVAYRKDVRCDWTKTTGRERQEHKQNERTKLRSTSNANGGERSSSNTSDTRLQGSEEEGNLRKSGEKRNELTTRPLRSSWEEFPIESPLCRRDDGLSERLDGITFPKWRRESIKAYGNAIVPQVAFEIFNALSGTNC